MQRDFFFSKGKLLKSNVISYNRSSSYQVTWVVLFSHMTYVIRLGPKDWSFGVYLAVSKSHSSHYAYFVLKKKVGWSLF